MPQPHQHHPERERLILFRALAGDLAPCEAKGFRQTACSHSCDRPQAILAPSCRASIFSAPSRAAKHLQRCYLCSPAARFASGNLGWPKVERVLQVVDAAEQLGVESLDACPDHWCDLHNRLAYDETRRRYTRERLRAWLLQQRTDT
jgi:hypothetical protein